MFESALFYMNEDGTAEMIDFTTTQGKALCEARKFDRHYGSLTGCCMFGGTKASTFAKPLRAEDVYSGAIFLNEGVMRKVGRVASYRIEFADGRNFWPPVSSTDLQRLRGDRHD